MWFRNIGIHPVNKSRGIELAGAGLLGFLSIVISVSIAGAVFNGSGILFGLGAFFVDSLGILAFGIPAYLFYAAFLLASPVYRPDRIFMLSCSLVPFLTLAIGFVFIRDFDYWTEQFEFFYWVGKGGFNFFTILLTVIEGLIIIAFSALLFPHERTAENRRDSEELTLHGSSAEQVSRETPRQSAQSFWKPSKSKFIPFLPPILKRVSRRQSDEAGQEKPHAAEWIDIEDIRLPDIKPLATATVFKELESLSSTARYKMAQKIEPEELPYIEKSTGYREDGIDILIEPAEEASQRRTPGSLGKDQELTVPGETPSSWGAYRVPMEGIFNRYPAGEYWILDQSAKDSAVILKETLREFNIHAEVTNIQKGPVITRFEILPDSEVKLSKIVNLQDNIALRLEAASIRIVAPIPGKHGVHIEVPNAKRHIVPFAEIMEEELHREGKNLELPVILGRDIIGEARIADLAQMPHLLIAGAAGSGKSVCINGLLLSILYRRSPTECRLIMIDPKIEELKRYNDIPHLLTPVITEPKRAFHALQYCIFEMERRYACFNSLGVQDLRSYNKRIKERGIGVEPLPYIVAVVNELADLIVIKELESTLAHLAAMSRATGIHLVLATQRLSLDVITGFIKAHIPSRIAFMVDSKMDSRIILNMTGAEKLLGKGDMLYVETEDSLPIRMQGVFVAEEEVDRAVEYVKTQGIPDYMDDELFIDDKEDAVSPVLAGGEDPLYERAEEIVLQQGNISTSYIQRRLKIGYNRATRLLDEMERRGLISPAQSSKPRALLD